MKASRALSTAIDSFSAPLFLQTFCAAALLFSANLAVQAQQPLAFKAISGAPVVEGGDTLSLGFAGGFNAGQFSSMDLDNDGLLDLVVFDRAGNRILPFRRKTGGLSQFEYAPGYVDSFPSVQNWMILYDYDCDGRKDVFCSAPAGIGVYRNTSSGSNLHFEWALGSAQSLQTDFGGTTGTTNLKVPISDVPAIADLDGDNAVDILSFSFVGINIEHHRNRQACGLDFYLKTNCWGGVLENFSNNSVQIDGCIAGKVENEIGAYSDPSQQEKVLHAGSTLLALDLNGDQKSELLLGDISYNNLTALYNDGSVDSAHISVQDSLFPVYDTPVDIFVFPSAHFVDVDGDGKRDLVVCPNVQAAENDSSAWYYQNTGTDAQPDFALQQRDLLQSEMIETGERSRPVLFDWDMDGLDDLFVGGTGRFISTGVYKSGIWHYRNVGDSLNPIFELQTQDFENLSALGLGERLHPAFGDLNNDGLPDVVLGTGDGILYVFDRLPGGGLSLASSSINGLDLGNDATPFLYDLSGDGLLDLLVGEANGNVNYLEQTIGGSNTVFVLVNERFGGVDMRLSVSNEGYSVPVIYPTSSGPRLIVGSAYLGIAQFDSLSNALNQPSVVMATLGVGSQTSPDYRLTPFGESKKSGRNLFLVKASELSAAGLSMGTIEKIGFEVSGSNHSPIDQGVSVRFKQVQGMDSLTGFDSSGFSEVVQDGFQPLILTSGWNDLSLHRNFIWDGVSDLLVEVCFSRNTTSTDIPVKLHDAGFASNAYGDISNHNTNTANGCTQPFEAASHLRPNIRFTLRPQARKIAEYAYSGQYLAPAVSDLDSDGKPELLLGDYGGGVRYFKGEVYVQEPIGHVETPANRIKAELRILPNPNSGRFAVRAPGLSEGTPMGLFDVHGRVLRTFEYAVDLEMNLSLPSGVYFIRTLETTDVRFVRFMVR